MCPGKAPGAQTWRHTRPPLGSVLASAVPTPPRPWRCALLPRCDGDGSQRRGASRTCKWLPPR
eukprot:10362206-Lingulodinium_polyedra.AAC.1